MSCSVWRCVIISGYPYYFRIQLIRKLGADANGAPFAADVEGYFDVIEQLLSASLKDLVGCQREAALRGLGLNPSKAVPSFRVAPIAGG